MLLHDDTVLVIDETGFIKLGRTSCGVGRQYTGSADKITNCEIRMCAAHVSYKRHDAMYSGPKEPKAGHQL